MAKTLEIYVWRFANKPQYTIGRIYVNGKYICDSLEDKNYDFDEKTPVSTIRQTKKEHPAAVAIPYGRYLVDVSCARGFANTHRWYLTAPLGSHIPCLVGVPGYSGILIHCGSNKDHTAGCILVGRNTVKGGLTDGMECYIKFATLLRDANAQGMKIYATISKEKPDFIQ